MDACTTVYIEFLNIMTMDTLTSATSIADSTHVVEPLQAIGAGPDLDIHQDHAISSADFTHMVGGAKFKLPKRPPPTKTPTVHTTKRTTRPPPLTTSWSPTHYTRKRTIRKPHTTLILRYMGLDCSA